MNRYSSILTPEDSDRLNARKSFSRFNGKCPTCDDTGEFAYNGHINKCEKDFDGVCIQKKLFMRYELANIPYRYQRFDWDEFDTQPEARCEIEKYISNLDNSIKTGIGIYIHSKGLGTGKTLIACHILKEAIKQGYKAYFCQFFDLVNISDDKIGRNLLENQLFNCDIICIDDVVNSKISEKQSDFFRYMLEKVIRDRVHNAMPIIMTSNLNSEKLLKEYDRVFSLLVSSCYTIELDSSFDYRIDAMRQKLSGDFQKNIAPIS